MTLTWPISQLNYIFADKRAVSFSLLIHGCLLAVLLTMPTAKISLPATKQQAIKSFLYKPRQKPEPKPSAEPESIPKSAPIEKPTTQPVKEKAVASDNPPQQAVKQELLSSPPAKTPQPINSHENKPRLSASEQLEKLRSTINRQISQQALTEQFQTRSHSEMHAAPLPVPHSVPQLSEEQIIERQTMRLADGLSIRKLDNGLCVTEQDLTAVGIAGVTSQQWFECGESKFDRSFREHMNKVREKLGK